MARCLPILCLGFVALAGCAVQDEPAVRMVAPRSTIVVLPGVALGSPATDGWIAVRNASVLGGRPPASRLPTHAVRWVHDVQRITSGRPNETLRVGIDTRTLLSP